MPPNIPHGYTLIDFIHSFISFDLAGVGSEDDRLNYSVLDSSPNCCTYVGFCRLG